MTMFFQIYTVSVPRQTNKENVVSSVYSYSGMRSVERSLQKTMIRGSIEWFM